MRVVFINQPFVLYYNDHWNLPHIHSKSNIWQKRLAWAGPGTNSIVLIHNFTTEDQTRGN
jgi:hypothetical protein